MKTKKPVPSDFDKNVVYPAGTECKVVENLANRMVLAEVRIIDEALVGGARYDTVLVSRNDLEE